jgi:periplasmic protein TonB
MSSNPKINETSNLKERSSRYLELSFILVLSFVIFGFFSASPEFKEYRSIKDIINPDSLVVIYRINDEPPPPPKRPQIPIETDDDDDLDLDDITIADTEVIKEYLSTDPPDEEDIVIDLIRLTVKPKIIKRVKAKYPDIAIKSETEGLVVIELVVDKKGVPRDLKVIKGHPMLNKAAIDAISEYRFQPGLQRGKAVRVKWVIPVRFRLKI